MTEILLKGRKTLTHPSIHYDPWPMDASCYQYKPEILILNFNKKERPEIVFLHVHTT